MATPPVTALAGPTADPAPDEHGLGPLYGLDIETDTSVDGLDPTRSGVVAVAVSSAERDVVLTGEETQLLARLDRHLAGLAAGTIVTWNGAAFDLPFLAERARRRGVALGLRLRADTPASGAWPPPPDGLRAHWYGHRHLDGFRVYRADVRRTTGLSCGLKSIARLVGLAAVEVDRERLHLLSDDDVRAYVASDARLARELTERRLPGAARWVDARVSGARVSAERVSGARDPVAGGDDGGLERAD